MRRLLPSTTSLAAFEAAARHLSFSRAAEELHLTQSAISKQVAALEALLGVALFTRVRQRLQLTPAGSMLAARAAPLMSQLEAAMLEVAASDGRGGALQLAVVPTFATRWLIPRLPAFNRAHPDTTIHLATRTLPFEFVEGGPDAAIHYGAPHWPQAICDYLMGEECVVASPATARELRTPQDLADTTLIHQSTRPHAWRDWMALAGVDCPNKDAGPRFELFSMISQAVRAGLGVAVVPRFLVEEELAAGELVVPFEQTLVSDFAYYLVYPEHKAPLPSLRAFREWLLEVSDRGKEAS